MDKFVKQVIGKYLDRAEAGLQKYGTNLERNDLTTDEWLNHLQEELMDATLYIERLKQELCKLKDALNADKLNN